MLKLCVIRSRGGGAAGGGKIEQTRAEREAGPKGKPQGRRMTEACPRPDYRKEVDSL